MFRRLKFLVQLAYANNLEERASSGKLYGIGGAREGMQYGTTERAMVLEPFQGLKLFI